MPATRSPWSSSRRTAARSRCGSTASGVVGTVVVSGLPQLEDHAFVVEMLEAHLAAAEG